MSNQIHVLSDETINQIAAGEVIENPASVVKELIENAVDAGATRVCVETLGGGFQLIRISDNGSGMGKEDALLCLQRHATSKIGRADDLLALTTLGFRGEALASIAAVSQMTLLTASEEPAVLVEVEGGKMTRVEPGARARGTTLEVRSLFYNVPARKKFQKTAPVSTAEITKAVTELALAHPEVGFELVQQERVVFSVQEGDQLTQRSALLLGEDFHVRSFQLELVAGPCDLKGLIGTPLTHRHNRGGQHLFVNRRPVVCPQITWAIRDAYGTRLPTDRHPIYALHLTLPSHLIDVNVHPQKKEIRLREEKLLKESIRQAINGALQRAEQPFLAEPQFVVRENVSYNPDQIFPLRFSEVYEEKIPELPLPPPSQRGLGVFSHYLILAEDTGLLLVDLQAAEARVLFETLLARAETVPLSQGLLIPLTLHLDLGEAALVEAHEEVLRKLGIEIRSCGKNTFLIDALPPAVLEADVPQMVKELIETLETSAAAERVRHLARTVSRFARARKKTFMLQEAEELYKQLVQTSSPYLCPHGRPTMVPVSQDEIEAKFTGKATHTAAAR